MYCRIFTRMWWKRTRVWPPQSGLCVNDTSTSRIWQESVCHLLTQTRRAAWLNLQKNKEKNNASSQLRGSGSFRVSGGLRCLGRLWLSPVVLLRSADRWHVDRLCQSSWEALPQSAGVASLLVISQGVAVLQREEASPLLTKTLLPGEGGRGRADTAARGRSGSWPLTLQPTLPRRVGEKKKNQLPQIGSYDRQFVSHRLSGRWTATALQFPVAKRPEEASTQPSVAWSAGSEAKQRRSSELLGCGHFMAPPCVLCWRRGRESGRGWWRYI